MKSTVVCILIDRLMIPLYQTNPHNNSVRKNVRGLAVMGMLLGLLHEFGLDLLSPGNLVEHISSISEGLGSEGPVDHTSCVRWRHSR
jgi:hypothetical protein